MCSWRSRYPVSPAWLSDALVFIRANISRNLTAADVYAHVGKSHTLVDHAFREAEACGYSSLQYFSTSFLKAFGKSPSAFRD